MASRRRSFDPSKLRAARTNQGMSRTGLATAAKVYYDQLKGYEAGKREPTLAVADALARALGVPIESFLSDPTADEAAQS